MKDIAAVIFDLDDTLLKSDKTISAYTLDILHRCRASGIYTGIATARSEISAGSSLPLTNFDIVISNGGACAAVGGRCIYEKLLPADTVRRILDAFFALGGDEISVETKDGYFWNYKTEPTGSWAHAIYSDFTNFYRPAYKMTAQLQTPEQARQICRQVENVEAIGFSGYDLYRFAAVGADKAAAVRAVAKQLGVDMAAVAAFGDDHNDIGMIKAAGMGVAMGNAVDAVKAVARYTALSNDEDGAARFIAENILRRRP